jgi:hypothetical protein
MLTRVLEENRKLTEELEHLKVESGSAGKSKVRPGSTPQNRHLHGH